MRTASPLITALLVLCACGTHEHGPASLPDLNWEGELRTLPGDTAFMPCDAHRAYRITGPGLDSLAHRYAWLHTSQGQWIKTWCSGHLAPGTTPGADSVLVATAYQHMDAQVHCPPLPVDSLAGSYQARVEVPGGTHEELLNFLPGGDAVIITTMPGLHAEVDGRWGLNSAGDVTFQEADGHYSFAYRHTQGGLVRALANGQSVAYELTGPARRLAGAFGRTARWFAAVAAAHGDGLDAERLRPAMRIDSLFPDPSVRAALRLSAMDSLGLDERSMATTWDAAGTLRDAARLMRKHLQAQR